MKALLVIDSDTACRLVSFYLEPLGFEFIRYRSPLKAMDNIEEIDPEAVIVSAEDFPRHWKTIVQFIRSERDKKKTTIVILKGPTFSYEDAAKAAQIGVDGIASDNLEDPEELDRLQNMLGRYRPVKNGRRAKRVRPADWDRVEFIFTIPDSGAIVTGRVTSLSSSGLAFEPDDPAALAAGASGTRYGECSLRVGSSILSPSCVLVRASPSFAFSFDGLADAERAELEKYIQERPLKGRMLRN